MFQPQAVPGCRASLNHTRQKETDNLPRLSEAQLLWFEELCPDRVQLGPNLPGDPAGWAGPVTYLDTSRINAASARMDTLDMQLRYGLELANGAYLEFWGNGTWTLKAEQQVRSEEHTSELQSLMRISYAVFCLKNKKKQTHTNL